MARIITITSGKGGVGKTNLSVNLGIRLAELGFKTCLFDADLGLANINILLGLVPQFTLADLIQGDCRFDDLLIKDIHGIDIIPGSTGVSMLADLGPESLESLITSLSGLESYDYILIDTSAGISNQVIAFCMAASHVILTVIPEPTSLTDAYSLLKVLNQNGYEQPASVLVNRSKTQDFGERIFNKFRDTVHKFLPVTIHYLGSLVEDEHISEAVTRQTPFTLAFPQSPASHGIKDIAAKLIRLDTGSTDTHSMALFLRKIIQRLNESKTTVPQKKSQVKQPTHSIQEDPDSRDRIEKDELVSQVLMALTSLVKNTERISEELTALRQTMEQREEKERGLVEKQTESLPSVPVIDLDFEKFVKETGTPRTVTGTHHDEP